MIAYKITAEKAREFAAAIKENVPMDEIRAACSIQPDRSIIYYAKSDAEFSVCREFGVI